jgi:glycosyltransferase involved in cell wall biosynthesis
MTMSDRTIWMYDIDPKRGHARYVHQLMSALAEIGPSRGVNVALVTAEDLADEFRCGDFPIHAVLPAMAARSTFPSKLGWWRYLLAYQTQVNRTFASLLDAHPECSGVHFQYYAPWLAHRHFPRYSRKGKAVFATVHNVIPHKPLPLVPNGTSLTWNRSAWQSCTGLFVHSDSLCQSLSAFLGSRHPPIFVTPHGVWKTTGPSEEEDPAELVQRRHLLIFGVIRENKGVLNLLRALKLLPEFTLTIAGEPRDAKHLADIQAMASSLPSGQVRLREGYVTSKEMGDLFQAASLVVLPYTSFVAQSGVLHDALAFRRPVVVTDVGAMGESVRSWKIGQVVTPNDEWALAQGIRALSEPDTYKAAYEAIPEASRGSSWQTAAIATLNAYLSRTSR